MEQDGNFYMGGQERCPQAILLPQYHQHLVNLKVSSAKRQDIKRSPSANWLSPQEDLSGRERIEKG